MPPTNAYAPSSIGQTLLDAAFLFARGMEHDSPWGQTGTPMRPCFPEPESRSFSNDRVQDHLAESIIYRRAGPMIVPTRGFGLQVALSVARGVI